MEQEKQGKYPTLGRSLATIARRLEVLKLQGSRGQSFLTVAGLGEGRRCNRDKSFPDGMFLWERQADDPNSAIEF